MVVVGWNDTTSTVASIRDTAGNTYALAVGPTRGTNLSQSIYYAPNIKGGSNTVTVTFNQAAVYVDVRILEYSGLAATLPLDVASGASGSGSPANSGSATTTSGNDLIVGADTVQTGNSGPGAGFIARIITLPDSDLVEDRIVTSTGTYNATGPLTSGGAWVMQMAAFRASGQGSTNPAPTVSSISPTSGPTAGGTAVSITGTGFVSGASVSIGGTAASNVVVVSGTSITAKTPAHAAGAVNVVVTNSDGQSGTLTGGYVYTSTNPAPTVSSISPTSGPIAGGTAVSITGTGFVSGASVSIGGTAASNVVVVSGTSITAKTPAHAAGAVNVVVTNSDGQSGTLTNGYTYSSGSASISFAQLASATPQSPVSTVSVTYPAAQAAGDLNVVVVGWNDTTSTVASIRDTAGNTYALAVGPTRGTNLSQSIYYAPNIKGGSNTVTVTFNQAAVYVDVRILEYSGLAATLPLDVASGASGSGSPANSGSATTTSGNDLIVGADTVQTGNSGPGAGFIARIITLPDSDLVEDRIVTSTGTYNATGPLTSGGAWVMQMAAFRSQ